MLLREVNMTKFKGAPTYLHLHQLKGKETDTKPIRSFRENDSLCFSEWMCVIWKRKFHVYGILYCIQIAKDNISLPLLLFPVLPGRN